MPESSINSNENQTQEAEEQASLYFALRHNIQKISLDTNEMTTIINKTNASTTFDYSFHTGTIFWNDLYDEKIYKTSPNESSEQIVINKDLKISADVLAVDWIYNNLYYTDLRRPVVCVMNSAGTMIKELIKDDLEEPRGLALDPINGFMYWGDWGSNPRIERAGMDGTNRQILVRGDIRWPKGLTLDLVSKRIYWVDAKLKTISSCNYDGSDRRVVLESSESLQHPYSVATFEDWVYWSDWENEAIFKANKLTGDNIQKLTPKRMVIDLISRK